MFHIKTVRTLTLSGVAVTVASVAFLPLSVAAQTDSSTIGPAGTAYVTRVIPVPTTVSVEAQRMLARPASDVSTPETLANRRMHTDEWQNRTGRLFQAIYPVKVEESRVAGVPVRIVTPMSVPQNRSDRILIDLHGGGFNSDSGSLTESVPVAYLSQTRVIAVLYSLARSIRFQLLWMTR